MPLPSPLTRRARGAVVLAAAVGLCVPATAPAAAAPGVALRPVPNADVYRGFAGGAYTFAVLENDETRGLFDTGELSLCGVSVTGSTEQVLFAEIDRTDPSRVYVELNRTASGTAEFTYDACQGDRRATSTVSVVISRLTSPTVVKHRRKPGLIVVTNPNSSPMSIVWGSPRTNAIDGQRTVRPLRKVRIPVQRTRISWVAFVRDQGAVVSAGDGAVRGIKKQKRSRR